MSDTGSDEPERKRQRLEASDALVMDVNSSAKWDFLAPWCEELKDQLVSIPGGLIRVLGPRRKREKPFRFNFEDDDDDEEEKVDPQEEEKEIEQALWRTREAIELLSLVAQVDQRAFHMLMTQHCGLQLEDEESEEEEEEFRPMIPGEVDDDFVFFEDDESDDGEEEGEEGDEDEEREQHEDNADDARADRGGQDAPGAVGSEIDADGTDTEREDDDAGPDERDGEDGNDDDEEEEHDDVFVLPPDSLNSERKRERETFISVKPRFDFISLRDIPGAPEVPGSLFAECEKLMLAEYQPSAAYMKAKKSILDMLPAERKVQQRIQRSLEIPVSLELTTWSKSADQLAGNVMELSSFMEAEKEYQATVAHQWNICQTQWLLREGTAVQFTEQKGDERVLVSGDPLTLRQETLVILVESDADDTNDEAKSEWLDVIIPGYGQCRVPRDSAIAVPSEGSDSPVPPIGVPLASLSLSLKAEAGGLPGLIKQIGWSLEKLSLSFHREVDVNAMVPTLLRSCPKMTKLSLCESFIDLDRFSTTYETLGDSDGADAPVIRTLEFQDYYGIGDSEGKLFMKRLGDPTTRLAKDLRELSLLAEEYAEPLDHPTLSELWMAMEKNATLEKLEVMVSRTMWSAIWKRRLRQFHGQVLPPRSLPLSCKLAFLSACQPSDSSEAEKTSAAAHNLDRRVLSLIFEFAATRVVRSVKVWG
ncbi:uncharacterized protein IUM83_04855 [Phytophthora cinnamomi]|uniref:uncharacterized protein n=1 Tax=Phytophthora cinnamomi TaxID=4785 RepID=UPI0035597FD6|nr:hypothetical protein IUM83_04855 [Phytophthora cinnamomi]